MSQAFSFVPTEGWVLHREWRFDSGRSWRYVAVGVDEAHSDVGLWYLSSDDAEEPADSEGGEPTPIGSGTLAEVDALIDFLGLSAPTAQDLRRTVAFLQTTLST